jgi:hypothetical protein
LEIWQNKTDPIIKASDVIVFFDVRNTRFQLFAVTVLLIFLASQILSFTLIYFILKILRQNSQSFTRQTYKLQIQLALLLLAQLLTPILYVFLPVFGTIVITLLQVNANRFSVQIGLLGIMVYGLSNCLLTIGFIGNYRRHFLDTFIFPWLRPLSRFFGFKQSTVVTNLQHMHLYSVTRHEIM